MQSRRIEAKSMPRLPRHAGSLKGHRHVSQSSERQVLDQARGVRWNIRAGAPQSLGTRVEGFPSRSCWMHLVQVCFLWARMRDRNVLVCRVSRGYVLRSTVSRQVSFHTLINFQASDILLSLSRDWKEGMHQSRCGIPRSLSLSRPVPTPSLSSTLDRAI